VPNLISPSLSLSAAFSWGAADFSGGIATKRSNVFSIVIIAHATGLVFMLLLAVASGEAIPGPTSLLWALAAGAAGGAGLACLYKALAVGKMGLTAPLSAVITALVPVVFNFGSEGLPHGSQLLGFALAFVSIWLIARQSGGAGASEGFGLAIAAGAGFGGFLLFIKFAGVQAVFWPLVVARAASLGLMVASNLISRGRWRPAPGMLRYVLLAGVLDSGANALYVAATQHGRLDVAAVLSSLYPASTVLLARVVLKERLSRLQSAGMGTALLAVMLIAR
jgi:drug/metabolite transporter (DMT)-like permease